MLRITFFWGLSILYIDNQGFPVIIDLPDLIDYFLINFKRSTVFPSVISAM